MDEPPFGIRELVAACALAFVATGAAAASEPVVGPARLSPAPEQSRVQVTADPGRSTRLSRG